MTQASEPALIVHVIHSLGTGGLENGLINLINRTPDDRYRHAIVCLAQSGVFERRIAKPGVQIISLHRRPGNDFSIYWKLWKALRGLKPAIVHTRNLSALEGQIPAFFLLRVKTVHGVHGRDVFDLDGDNRKYNLLRKLIRPLVGRYITVSRDLKDWLRESVGVPVNKVTQIYNGVDQTRFCPRSGDKPDLAPAGFLRKDKVVTGTVGRLAAVKDQANLIQAFNRLLSRHPENRDLLRLVIAGDGPERGRLEKLVEDLWIQDCVWITGDRDDIPDVLKLFDIFVLPSLGEGISNTILEAMATGLPIIATHVGGNPELVEEGVNGHLVPRDNHVALAESMEKLIHSRSSRKTMGEAGLKKVRAEFDWNKTVAGYLAVYDEVLDGK